MTYVETAVVRFVVAIADVVVRNGNAIYADMNHVLILRHRPVREQQTVRGTWTGSHGLTTDPVQVCVPGVAEDLLVVGGVSLHVAGHRQRVRHQDDPVPEPPVFRVQLDLMLLSKTWNPTSNFCSDQQNHTNILEHTLSF